LFFLYFCRPKKQGKNEGQIVGNNLKFKNLRLKDLKHRKPLNLKLNNNNNTDK